MSQSRSSPLSQCASLGRSVTKNKITNPTRTVGMASPMNIHFQPASPKTPLKPSRIPVEIGAPAATATGSATMNPETMRARCQSGNQYVKNRIMPGNSPASASPSKKRMVTKLHGPVQNAVAPDNSPQLTMIRAIQIRAPTFSRMMLLGTSNRK